MWLWTQISTATSQWQLPLILTENLTEISSYNLSTLFLSEMAAEILP